MLAVMLMVPMLAVLPAQPVYAAETVATDKKEYLTQEQMTVYVSGFWKGNAIIAVPFGEPARRGSELGEFRGTADGQSQTVTAPGVPGEYEIQLHRWYSSASADGAATSMSTLGNASFSCKTSITVVPTTYITWEANGGNLYPKTSGFKTGAAFGSLLPKPTKEGYYFDGWYTSSTGGAKITSASIVPSAKATYYARWAPSYLCLNRTMYLPEYSCKYTPGESIRVYVSGYDSTDMLYLIETPGFLFTTGTLRNPLQTMPASDFATERFTAPDTAGTYLVCLVTSDLSIVRLATSFTVRGTPPVITLPKTQYDVGEYLNVSLTGTYEPLDDIVYIYNSEGKEMAVRLGENCGTMQAPWTPGEYSIKLMTCTSIEGERDEWEWEALTSADFTVVELPTSPPPPPPPPPVAPEIITQPKGGNIGSAGGGTVTFSVVATGTPDPSYQWQQSTDNGASWKDVTGSSSRGSGKRTKGFGMDPELTLENVPLEYKGYLYRCIVRNSAGSVTSNSAKILAVKDLPEGGLIIPPGGLPLDVGGVFPPTGGITLDPPGTGTTPGGGGGKPFPGGGDTPTTPGFINPPLSGGGTITFENDKVLVEAIESGVKIDWEKQDGPQFYRVFRSAESGKEGISITDFAIRSTGYVDVNMKAGTTYYYTVRQVLADADPWNDIPELLGDPIAPAKMVTTNATILEPVGKGEKHFILMEEDDPYMSVDGDIDEIDPGRGTVPLNRNGRVILPIRAVIEAIGGTVGWDGDEEKITLKTAAIEVVMWLDKKDLMINGVSAEMDVAPIELNGRTMVPVRFAAESSGCTVEWLNATQQIVVVFYMPD